LLVNPVAGTFSRKALGKAEEIVRQRGLKPELVFSTQPGEMRQLAKDALTLAPEMILVFGGDGTFNEAVNGLTGSEVPVAFIPLGTTNVLAKELSVPERSEAAVQRAVEGTAHRISLGKVLFAGQDEHYFIMMAGAGFDANAVRGMNQSLKSILGKGAYIVSGLKEVFSYDPSPIEIRAENGTSEGYAVIVGNGAHYGGRFRITPDASLFEPLFQVFVMKNKSRSSLLRTAFRIAGGRLPHRNDVEYLVAERIELHGSAHLQTDGDYRGGLPVDIMIERDCLDVIY